MNLRVFVIGLVVMSLALVVAFSAHLSHRLTQPARVYGPAGWYVVWEGSVWQGPLTSKQVCLDLLPAARAQHPNMTCEEQRGAPGKGAGV